MFKIFVTLLSVLTSFQTSYSQPKVKVDFKFYSEDVSLSIDLIFSSNSLSTIDVTNYTDYFNEIKPYKYSVTLAEFLEIKDKMNLNDWFYYRLIQRTSMVLYDKKEENNRQYFVWFFLNKSGFDVRLIQNNNSYYCFVYTNDKVYSSTVEIEGKKYTCLDWRNQESNDLQITNPNGSLMPLDLAFKPFSFVITELPIFSNSNLNATGFGIRFDNGEFREIEVNINKSVIDLLWAYPTIDFSTLLNFPIPKEALDKITKLLLEYNEGKVVSESILGIKKFVEFAGLYSNNDDIFLRPKIYTPYEALYYGSFDSWDYSIFFAYLVKKIFDIPLIFILSEESGDRNIGIGLSFDGARKDIEYKGVFYEIYYDWDGKEDVNDEMKFDLNQNYTIVGEYIPK